MLTKEQEACLNRLIEEGYGESKELAKHLDAAVEMLFYVEEETFVRKDIQNVVSALRGISIALRK